MALSGHKTISVLRRYNRVTEEELAAIKWPERESIDEAKATVQSGDSTPLGG